MTVTMPAVSVVTELISPGTFARFAANYMAARVNDRTPLSHYLLGLQLCKVAMVLSVDDFIERYRAPMMNYALELMRKGFVQRRFMAMPPDAKWAQFKCGRVDAKAFRFFDLSTAQEVLFMEIAVAEALKVADGAEGKVMELKPYSETASVEFGFLEARTPFLHDPLMPIHGAAGSAEPKLFQVLRERPQDLVFVPGNVAAQDAPPPPESDSDRVVDALDRRIVPDRDRARLRKAVDRADAPLTGRAGADEGLRGAIGRLR